jgi:integrase
MFALLFAPLMASIFQKPKSPFYFAAYRDATGRRVQRTTKQTKRSDALDIANKWERLASKGRAGILTESIARKVVSEILESATGEPLQYFTARAWFDEWLAGKRGTTAPATLAKYEQTTRDFIAHLGERADLTLAAISPKDVRSFRDALAKGGRAPSTVNMAINKTLSAPFLAALRLGYVPTNPCAAVEPLRDDTEAARDTFTTEQVGALVTAAEGDWRGAILCGYFTGLRLRDVAEMTWSAVDFTAGVFKVKARKTGTTNIHPFGEEIAAWLRAQPRGIGKAPVFPALAGKGTGGRHGLSGRFKSIMEKAGIKGRTLRGGDGGKGRTTSSLSFHSLRHTFNSALANAGVPQELRQKLTGHASIAMNNKYTHHELETLRGAVAKLPRVGVAG